MFLPTLTACVLAVSAASEKPKNPPEVFTVEAAGDRVNVTWPGCKSTADRVQYDAGRRQLVLLGTDARPVTVVGGDAGLDRLEAVNVVVRFADGSVTASSGR